MTEKNRKTFEITEQGLTILLRFMTVLMLPMVLTAVLSMLRLLTYGKGGAFWDISCLFMTQIFSKMLAENFMKST